MTITQLEYIIAVSREGNFRKAAISCHVTQPTLSAQIHKVEEELGVVLFDRTKSPTIPTKIGENIIKQAEIGLCEIKKIEEIIQENRGIIKGTISIGAIPTISAYLTPHILKSFCKKYPDVEVVVQEMNTDNCLEELNNEKIDIAILATSEDLSMYSQEHLFDEELFLYLNKNHPLMNKTKIKASDIKTEDIWLLDEGHCLRDEVIEICKIRKNTNKRPAKIVFKVGSLESLKHIVNEQGGYTLIPKMATKHLSSVEKKQLRKFSPEPSRPIYLTKRRVHLKKALIDAFKNEILDIVN